MKGKKKLPEAIATSSDSLLTSLLPLTSGRRAREAVLKDIMLLEAALVSDKIVISTDDTAKRFYQGVVFEVPELAEIMWINPLQNNDDVIEWLQNGAQFTENLSLGYRTV